MRSILIVGVLIAGTVCAGQAPPKKPAPARKPPAAQSTLVCPDADAQQGCKSYQELVRAKDKSLPDGGYICFRKKADEFFAFRFNKPYFIKDGESKQMVTDETPRRGSGYAQTYVAGVLDSARMPTFNFWGHWQPSDSPELVIFTSEKFNGKQRTTTIRAFSSMRRRSTSYSSIRTQWTSPFATP